MCRLFAQSSDGVRAVRESSLVEFERYDILGGSSLFKSQLWEFKHGEVAVQDVVNLSFI